MKSNPAWIPLVLCVLCAGPPAAAEITVHFASVFNTSGEKIEGVWLVGVDCGDGEVKGAGPCGDDPAKCASTAAKKMCGASAEAGSTVAGRDRPVPELRYEEGVAAHRIAALVDGALQMPGSAESPASGSWTGWLDRDTPSGSGDYETLADFVKAGQACPVPVEVQCRTRDGRDWQAADQSYTCSPEIGGVCRNSDQSGGRCLDYEVRFRCPSGPQLALSCNDDQSRCTCDSASSCAVLKLICTDWDERKRGKKLVGWDCKATTTRQTAPH